MHRHHKNRSALCDLFLHLDVVSTSNIATYNPVQEFYFICLCFDKNRGQICLWASMLSLLD